MSSPTWSSTQVDEAIDFAAGRLGYEYVKDEQRHSVKSFVEGNDVFVSLPTGYGKSLCFIMLPWVFDRLRGTCNTSIALCVSPLTSLMMDQCRKYREMGITVEVIGESQSEPSACSHIEKGHYQLLYISPESLIGNPAWREMLRNDVYQRHLVAFIVDEAHCVKKW